MLENYYHIIEEEIDDHDAEFIISLNANHTLYEGHFPEFPLLPGVVQMELIQELLEKAIDQQLILSNAKNIKYLGMINPQNEKRLKVKLHWVETEGIKLKAELISMNEEAKIMLKYSAQYQKI